jgi:rSAM/selenodomain-associated transferase 2
MSMKFDDSMNISIIIPVYNEASIIETLMDNLEQFRHKAEIIFVDGGSSDGTDKIIEKRYNIVHSLGKGRANQMNYGALLSKGSILLFLHADSILDNNAIDEVQRVILQGYKAGCFRIKFDSNSFLMKICGFMSNNRVRFRNIAFGDQGIFITREYFNQLGCYANIPLMEDYKLSMSIKADGQKIALANSKIITSERRFIKFDNNKTISRLKTMVMMQKLQYMFRKGKDIKVIANLYK